MRRGVKKRLTISRKKKIHGIQRASGSNMAGGFLTAVLEARIECMVPSDLWTKVSSHCYAKYGDRTDNFLTKNSTLPFLRRTHTTKARGEASQRRKWGVGHRREVQGNPGGLGRAIPGERLCT